MAKKRATKKSSTRSEPPLPPKDSTVGKQPRGLPSSADVSRANTIRQNDIRIQTAKMDLQRSQMQDARRVAQGSKSQLSPRSVTQTQYNIDAMERQSPQGSRYNPNRKMPSNVSVPRLPDKISGRTTDAGTRSILDGMKNFMKSGFRGGIRGGGGGRPDTRL